ncbi:unnamed protein product [Urochloa humidicola]
MDQAENDQRHRGVQQQQEDLLRLLPEDILDDVLRRLAPRELSVLRCAGKAWRAAVEARGLLLPRAVGGIFVWWNDLDSLEFIARPTAGTPVSGRLADIAAPNKPTSRTLRDHCNGLLLFHHCVVNPATRSWAPLPPRPPEIEWHNEHFYYYLGNEHFYYHEYLVFDPAVSPHHEVFAIPKILYKDKGRLDPTIEKSEWPPSPWNPFVFSSRTGQWEERMFLRDGAAAGTVASMRWSSYERGEGHYAAYWQGELYVHYDGNYFIRIFLLGNKYQVIKPPLRTRSYLQTFHLGRSEKGVYCALTYPSEDSYWLRVWILKERCGYMRWVLKNQTNLESLLACRKVDEQFGRPWILRDINYHEKRDKDDDDDDDDEEVVKEFQWDSDDDNVLQIGDNVEDYYRFYYVLGFHPYKEVVFLNESRIRGLAYHFSNSKVQDLGNIRPRNYGAIAGHGAHIKMSFPYTPCWMGEYPVQN